MSYLADTGKKGRQKSGKQPHSPPHLRLQRKGPKRTLEEDRKSVLCNLIKKNI